jgi:DNA-binding winged helix-turn-helix (wHTH) protein/tetratricopeptide (TPR) repeat protein
LHPEPSPREIFRFGPFELDVEREELSRSGLTLRIPRQPLRLLALLVRRAGETITREEIQQELWGSETYVDYEQGINTAVRQIRYHLGDSAEAPRYVRTIPRRGYVFIATVERVAAPNEPAEPEALPEETPAPRVRRRPRFRRSTRIFAAVLAMLVAAVMLAAAAGWLPHRHRETPPPGKSRLIAIRPFEVLGRVPDGIDPRAFGEEIRATLDWLPRRHVALVDANRAARADSVIEGTIQQLPDGIRVIVSGIDVASRTQVWSATIDRPAARAPDLAIETAARVLQEVAERHLPPPRHEPLVRTRVSPRALALYRHARVERVRWLPDRDWSRAKNLFEQAVREEPRFGEAWSALADLWAERMLRGPDRAADAARARDYARRALALQPDNVEAHSALAIVSLQHDYDLGAAEDGFRRAVAADPEYVEAHFNLAIALTTRGRFDEALRELRAARQLDPVTFHLHPSVPMLYLYARRYEDAVAAYDDILAVRPEATNIRWGLLSVHVIQRQWAGAIEQVSILAELPPAERSRVPPTAEGFRELYRRVGPQLYARDRLPAHDFGRAIYFAELGDRERALSMLERAIAARTPSVSYLLVDPRFDPLRGDPRFNTLIATTNLGRTDDD